MANCKVCGQPIPRGQRFQTECYKTVPFCSEKCYQAYIQKKEEKPKQQPKDKHLNRLKDYINELWDGNVNWPFMMRQLKHFKEEYSLDSKGVYLVLKYAVVYEGYVVDSSYGLGQFVKFIEPAQKFADDIQRNKDLAEDLPDEIVVVRKPCKQKRLVKEEDWDD